VRGQGRCLAHPTLKAIAGRHGRSAAQALLRWHIESGFVAIPKSATPARIAENIDVFDVELTKEDRIAIASLDRADGRIGPDPLTLVECLCCAALSGDVVTMPQGRLSEQDAS
jgi:2,5-diketo-D-gluconate reductase A